MPDDELNGTATDTAQGDQGAATSTDTTDEAAGATTGDGSQTQQQKEESFIDPSSLPEELKPHWKRMHGTYNKRLSEIAADKDRAEFAKRFESDPDFAAQQIQARAAKLGMTITKAQAQQAAATGSENAAPREVVEQVRKSLSPELQWMAEQIANSQWALVQSQLKPLQEQRQTERLQAYQAQYDSLIEDLSGKAPGWETHENEMLELLEFIKGPDLSHKKFGSKPELLYRIVTGNASAVSEATRRMGEAARNKVSTGTAQRASQPNIEDRIRKAKNNNDAFNIAAKAAVEDLERKGVRVQ